MPELVLTDFVRLRGLDCPQRNLVGGDQRSATVAAASIIAKVTRDRLMAEADRSIPSTASRRHKGYPTEEHRSGPASGTGLAPCTGGPFSGVWTQGTASTR